MDWDALMRLIAPLAVVSFEGNFGASLLDCLFVPQKYASVLRIRTMTVSWIGGLIIKPICCPFILATALIRLGTSSAAFTILSRKRLGFVVSIQHTSICIIAHVFQSLGP